MVHKLAIVAFSGLVVSAVCMGAAATIGAREFGAGFEGIDFSMFGDKERCERVAADTSGSTSSNGSRTMRWDGSDHVSLNVPAVARYTPNGNRDLQITGDPQMVARVRVRDGKIELNCRSSRWNDDMLHITLPGTRFEKFGIAGSGKIELENLDQPELKVSIAGSGNIKATGKVRELEVAIAGSGDADLAQVAAEDVKVRIVGSGNADIAPRGEADIRIAGSGDVNLHSNPRSVETRIAGSGRIHNVARSSGNDI